MSMAAKLSDCVPMRSSMLAPFLVLPIIGVLCSVTTAQQDDDASIPSVDPKLFNKHRYLSPRVLFSADPPDEEPAGLQSISGRIRRHPPQRGVFSVCESISNWVQNKTSATDQTGREVTVLEYVTVNNVKMKQLFYETSCYKPPVGGLKCLGIDAKNWNALCTNAHTFVQALTLFESTVAWRFIRINAECVCSISKKSGDISLLSAHKKLGGWHSLGIGTFLGSQPRFVSQLVFMSQSCEILDWKHKENRNEMMKLERKCFTIRHFTFNSFNLSDINAVFQPEFLNLELLKSCSQNQMQHFPLVDKG